MRRIVVLLAIVALLASPVYAEKMKFDKISTGAKFVTNAGVSQQLSSSEGTSLVLLTATSINNVLTHDIIVYVGNSQVSAGGNALYYPTTTQRKGIRIMSNDVVSIPAADLSLLYVDAANSNDGVSWIALN